MHSTKQRLIDAGLRMLLQHGYNSLGIQALLEETNVPKGSFYHHFKDKEDFALQVLDAYMTAVHAGLDACLLDNTLLPLARKHDVGIMIRTPLARGLLSGKFPAGQAIPAEQQWRRPTGDRLQLRLGRVEQLRFLERDGQNLAQAALRWLLAQPGVHCVIPGARTVEQLEANIGAVDGDLTAEELARVKELHQQWRAEGRW